MTVIALPPDFVTVTVMVAVRLVVLQATADLMIAA
jgi:hypothetical protein